MFTLKDELCNTQTIKKKISSQRDCPGWRISDAGMPRASKITMFDEEFRKDDAMCRILQG
jgi:hypothetical protein